MTQNPLIENPLFWQPRDVRQRLMEEAIDSTLSWLFRLLGAPDWDVFG